MLLLAAVSDELWIENVRRLAGFSNLLRRRREIEVWSAERADDVFPAVAGWVLVLAERFLWPRLGILGLEYPEPILLAG